MSHEVELSKVAKDNPTVVESHCEKEQVDDEQVKEEKEDK